jgi:hypothetical protein
VPTTQAATLEVTDVAGVTHHPLDLHGDHEAVAFLFVGVDCPISNGYAPELNRIVAEFAKQGIDFYMVYPDADSTANAVRKHAHDYGYTAPAVLDPQHQLAKRFGATVTPEAAVVGPNGTMLYHGRIDDLYADLGKQRFAATTHDLREALDAIVHHRPVAQPITKAIGCEI